MPKKELRGLFPNIKRTRLDLTSEMDGNYNCAAWAIDDDQRWYEPYGMILPTSTPEYHRPEGLPHNSKPETYVSFFELYGYELADDETLEDGYTKIALYVRDGEFRHVARQVSRHRWTSKVGEQEDIEHALRALEKDGPHAYGIVSIFMKKPN